MKKSFSLSIASILVIFVMAISCNSQTSSQSNDEQNVQDQTKVVTVYYFHGDRRCSTCRAVGSVSRKAIEKNFADNGQVVYQDINIDEPENQEVKEKFELSGSGLFVYDGNEKEDLTAFAFQKAVEHPQELTDKLVSTVNSKL